MPNLIARSPFDGLLPLTGASILATELLPDAITSVAASPNADPAAFKAGVGMAFPSPNRATGKEGNRAIWTGPNQCFVLGARPEAIPGYTMTDQSDGWGVIRLDGDGIPDLLARLTSVDLRDSQFKRGHSARALLGHMNASITRTGAKTYDLMVFRSMANTAIHDLERAIRALEGRNAL